MRRFHCDRCGSVVAFDAMRCPGCGEALGYLSEELEIRALVPTPEPAVFARVGEAGPLWRCLNAAWGCNWMVPAGSDSPWCRSCGLTRGRPDEQRTVAMQAWMSAEAAKRRVLHQLDDLGLAVQPRSPEHPDGLAFDLVHVPGVRGITGHRAGIVTLDLAETDEGHRGTVRRSLDESFRTVVGHLRHEIGHHYWNVLIGHGSALEPFRRCFGDERLDYNEAIERHYAAGGEAWDPVRFITAYAASHPLEDWAETFAHYLHIMDVTDTAVAYALAPGAATSGSGAAGLRTQPFTDVLATWRPINAALTAIAESLGAPVLYPFDPVGPVVDKLAFVHRHLVGHEQQERTLVGR